jgi:polysaccharide pyruvyl transferase CsaB
MIKPSSPRRLVIFGNYGANNLGDEAILAGLLTQINSKKWQIEVISANPGSTNNVHQVKALARPPFGWRSLFKSKWSKTLKSIYQADLILFGGGGLFQDQERVGFTSSFALWYYYLRLCLILQRKRKIALVANSIGKISSPTKREKLSKQLAKVDFFSLRDEVSLKRLVELGIPKYKLNLATDAAFLLPKPRKGKVKRQILVALHGKNTTKRELNQVRKLTKELKDFEFKYIAMQAGHDDDGYLAGKLNLSLLDLKEPDALISEIKNSQLIITSRLHGAILAILTRTPLVATGRRSKVKNFLSKANLDQLYLQTFGSFKLREVVVETLSNHKATTLTITKALAKERELADFILPEFV